MDKKYSMVECKGILYRIANWFRKIFFKSKKNNIDSEKMQEKQEEQIQYQGFKDNIKIEEDKEQVRLLKMQQSYQVGSLKEEDIDEEDYEKLLNLYDEQNKKIEDEIEQYKAKAEKILKELKQA